MIEDSEFHTEYIEDHRFPAYQWARAIRPVLYENTGFDLKSGSPAEGEMLPCIWRMVLLAQRGLIEDWMRKHKAIGKYKVKKDRDGTDYLKAKIYDAFSAPFG